MIALRPAALPQAKRVPIVGFIRERDYVQLSAVGDSLITAAAKRLQK